MKQRLHRLAAPAAFAVALLLALIASRLTGPAFDELGRLRAVDQAEQIVRSVAGSGPGALSTPAARAVYASFDGRSTLLVLLGAWSKLSLGRVGLLDPLSAARLPWLIWAALGAASLFALVRDQLGLRAALLSTAILIVVPRWLHGVAVTSEGVAVASGWLQVLVAYARSIRGSRRTCWTVAGAALVGLGAAVSLATLWVLALIAVHFAIARRGELVRLTRRGRVPAPALLLAALPIAPLVLLATNPALWKGSTAEVARWLLAPLAPSVEATEYGGGVVRALPVPGAFAVSWLVQTLPLALSLAALAGAGWFSWRALARRFAAGRLRPPRLPGAPGALVLLGLGGALVGPALAPDVLTRFPPRVELALPFVALLAGATLDRIAALRTGRWIAAGVVAATAWTTLHAPATLAAAHTPLLGGPARVASQRALPVVDGSELGALARAIDALGQAQVTLHAPEVPPQIWDVLRSAGRLRTFVVTVPGGQGELELVRGGGDGSAQARVTREGAELWTLRR